MTGAGVRKKRISLNRDFARRHLFVAALMAALSLWFLYDGAVDYPGKPDEWFAAHHTERSRAIARQFQFSGLSALAAIFIALGVMRAGRATLEWDEEAMCGTLTGGKPLPFADVSAVDASRWERKGILVLTAKDGRRVKLDAWHHAGVEELVAERFPAVSAAASQNAPSGGEAGVAERQA